MSVEDQIEDKLTFLRETVDVETEMRNRVAVRIARTMLAGDRPNDQLMQFFADCEAEVQGAVARLEEFEASLRTPTVSLTPELALTRR